MEANIFFWKKIISMNKKISIQLQGYTLFLSKNYVQRFISILAN